jgi:hypothetical protein
MARLRSGYVRIDLNDILPEIENDVLLEEIQARKLDPGMTEDSIEFVAEAYRELLRGRVSEAMSILDRVLNPKWKSREACGLQYQKASEKML